MYPRLGMKFLLHGRENSDAVAAWRGIVTAAGVHVCVCACACMSVCVCNSRDNHREGVALI